MTAQTFECWVDSQNRNVLAHRGLAHTVFERLDLFCPIKNFLQVTLTQIYHVVLGFPFHIAGAIATTRDEDLLEVLTKNLYVEVGGFGGQRHIDVYRRLLYAVGAKIQQPSDNELWPETINLESTCSELYRSDNVGTKLGALFAFERMSSPMVGYWEGALMKVSWLKPSDYAFFTIHIDVELQHATDITKCCEKYWLAPGFRQSFTDASEAVMQHLEVFWNKVELYGELSAPKGSVVDLRSGAWLSNA